MKNNIFRSFLFILCFQNLYGNGLIIDNIKTINITLEYFDSNGNWKKVELNLNEYAMIELINYLRSAKEISVDDAPLLALYEGEYEIQIVFNDFSEKTYKIETYNTLYCLENKKFYNSPTTISYLRALMIKYFCEEVYNE